MDLLSSHQPLSHFSFLWPSKGEHPQPEVADLCLDAVVTGLARMSCREAECREDSLGTEPCVEQAVTAGCDRWAEACVGRTAPMRDSESLSWKTTSFYLFA